MFYEKENRLYVLKDEVTLVGVDMTPQVVSVEGTEIKVEDLAEYAFLTPSEARARYNISEETHYKFPVERGEVKRGRPSAK